MISIKNAITSYLCTILLTSLYPYVLYLRKSSSKQKKSFHSRHNCQVFVGALSYSIILVEKKSIQLHIQLGGREGFGFHYNN